MEPHADELVTLGVPDGRPERIVEIVIGLVDDAAVWARADPEDRVASVASEAARRRLPRLIPLVVALADELGASGVRASVQHDDLHGGNVLVGADGDRIFDWGMPHWLIRSAH